jgi:hypothetical protein
MREGIQAYLSADVYCSSTLTIVCHHGGSLNNGAYIFMFSRVFVLVVWRGRLADSSDGYHGIENMHEMKMSKPKNPFYIGSKLTTSKSPSQNQP